ncbi:MAG: HAD-IA family hydrolase [Pseudomonadales bacterium]
MSSIRAVLLDADGVIQLPGPAWRASLEALCADPERVESFIGDLFAAEKPCLTGAADFPSALAQVLNRWRSEVPLQDALQVWTQIEPAPEMLELVCDLRSFGLIAALATNQQAYRAGFMSTTLGYREHFDYLLYSCELGHCKPESGYFASALARMMIDPAEALFIDDHEANVAAARQCGLHAEAFHVSEGRGRIEELLSQYGIGEG